MDFLRLYKTLEDLLYEIMSWLVFYPLTMWRACTAPLKLMAYSNTEQTEKIEQQYLDTLSPPLFLILTVIIMHVIEIALHVRMQDAGMPLPRIFQSDEILLFVRTMLTSIFPLTYAVLILKRVGLPIDRKKLRSPFFTQCFPMAPFCIFMSWAFIFIRMPEGTFRPLAVPVMLLAIGWFLTVQALWLRKRSSVSLLVAYAQACFAFVVATVVIIALASILIYGPPIIMS